MVVISSSLLINDALQAPFSFTILVYLKFSEKLLEENKIIKIIERKYFFTLGKF
jgi:hypothetical protein